MENKKIVKFRRVKIKRRPYPKEKIIFFILLGLLFLSFVILIFNKVNPVNTAGAILEEQQENGTATIRAMIEVDNAKHLDFAKKFIRDITDEIKELDGIWSKEISDEEYVKIQFEQSLSSENDITIYPKVVSGSPRIEVYEKDGNKVLATFDSLISNEYNKIFLTNLQDNQDTFYLKVIGGSIKVDHIIDPIQEAKK